MVRGQRSNAIKPHGEITVCNLLEKQSEYTSSFHVPSLDKLWRDIHSRISEALVITIIFIFIFIYNNILYIHTHNIYYTIYNILYI